jgi:hypothetical protein
MLPPSFMLDQTVFNITTDELLNFETDINLSIEKSLSGLSTVSSLLIVLKNTKEE